MYEKALSIDPKRSDIHYNYAILLVKELKDFVSAREHLESAVRTDPKNNEARTALERLIKKKFREDKEKKGLFGRTKK